MFGFGFDVGFSILNVLFPLFFGAALTIFIIVIVRSVRQNRINNRSPRLTVDARVVSRRTEVNESRHPMGGDITGAHGYFTTSTTSFYVTFEVESGDRMEFHVPREQYVYIIEGDQGKLSFQGTRFLGFERA